MISLFANIAISAILVLVPFTIALCIASAIEKLLVWKKMYNSFSPLVEKDPDLLQKLHFYQEFSKKGPKDKADLDNFFSLAVSKGSFSINCWLDPSDLEYMIERLTWIHENASDTICIDSEQLLGQAHGVHLRVYFTSPEEAMAYKLRWN